MGRFMARVMQEGRYSNGLLLLATLLCLLLLRAEVSNVFWLQGRAAAVLAAMMLVLSNILGKALLESPEFGIGILDLVYAQCITLSFLGVAFTKFHPEKPSVIPQNAEQAVRLLCVGFFSSGSSMLIIAGMATGPVTAILLVMSLQTSFATAWKVLLGESIEPEEYVASPILLLAVAVGTAIGCQEVGGHLNAWFEALFGCVSVDSARFPGGSRAIFKAPGRGALAWASLQPSGGPPRPCSSGTSARRCTMWS